MKKSKSWIHVCVRFLLFITFGVHSATLKVTVTDDTDTIIPSLRQNIPNDYKIPVTYITKEVGGMCWANLNVFNVEQSLQELANKFGNISTNKHDIKILIIYFYEERLDIKVNLEALMVDFQCHYRTEKWETQRYFDFVKELYDALKHENCSNECEEPPCPTTVPLDSPTPPESPTLSESPIHNNTDSKCTTSYPSRACSHISNPTSEEPLDMMKLILLSSLFVSVLTIILMCVVWKVRSQSNRQAHQQSPGEDDSFTGSEGTEPPGSAETQEKIMLNVIETV
uniref:Kit ligand n=2 Tax=Nothobranchius korthausae TaxID=1143690 RepID=A0A1A8F5W8_9TELE